MLGLAIIGGEGPEPGICRLLAQEADLIVAADSGLHAAENAGIRPDWIIGDMDSLDAVLLEKYPEKIIIRFPADKDFTDTELALDLLREKGCDAVWIAGGGGGRLDHLLAVRSLFERNDFPSRWVTSAEDIYCLEKCVPEKKDDEKINCVNSEINFSLPLNSMVSVFPLGAGEWSAASRGLKWPLDNVIWNRGLFGISNRNLSETFSIRIINGRFMIILPLKRKS